MSIAFVTNLQAPKRVQPSNRAFDRPTGFTKPAAMVRADFCEHRLDATCSQALTVLLRTVASVTLNDFRFVQRASALSSYRWNGLDKWVELGNVVAIRAGQDDRERDALRVDDEMMLAAKLAPVRGIRACFFPPAWPESTSYRREHASNLLHHVDVVPPGASRVCVATRPLSAKRQVVANRLCPSRNPFPGVVSSTRYPSAKRTLCQ